MYRYFSACAEKRVEMMQWDGKECIKQRKNREEIR